VYLDLFHSHETIRLTGAELARHPRWRGLPEGHVPLRGLLAVRLINAAGAVNSVIMLSDKVHGDFSEEDEALLEQLAAVASLAMQHIEARTDAEHAAQAKGRFLANMSHELRTPMNAILGMTDLALAEDLSPSVRDCLQTAKESAELLLEMLGEILDFSRIEAEKLQLESTPFRLRQVLDQTLRPLALRAREKGIELACDVPAAVPDRLVGDTLRLRQILVNLVGNAVKFTPQGEVVVRVKEEGSEIGDWGLGKGDARPSGSEETAEAGRRQSSDEPPRSEVASLISQIPNPQSPIPNPPPPQVTLHFTVQDTGIGISAEDQQRIFAPFTQADASTTRQFGGTGLGLAIANSLVGLMGGRLWVHSGVGRGSTFHFTVQLRLRQGPRDEPADPARRQLGDLPVLPAEKNSAMPAALGRVAPPAAPAVRAPAALAARPLRVLLAEDTLSSQKVVVRILQRRGHTVQVADTGARAVELVRGHEFDVVLMDVQMPAMDGLEATRHIRRLEDSGKARLPVVAMTAHAMRGDRERCLEAGVDAYLAKPIHADELIAMVEQMAAGGGPRKASGPSRAGAGPETASEPETPFHAAEALARCAGQREILTEMVSFYQDNIRAWINELRAAAAAGSAAELARLGHRLRSTLIYLAAHRAEALAGQVEQLGASGDLGGAAAALEELTVALGDLEAGLRQFSP
jgi:signal transduction histidine kinase/DNA-binding response OmpR family regulator